MILPRVAIAEAAARRQRVSAARMVLVCASIATCSFLNTWVNLARDDSTYYARWNPSTAVLAPVLWWEALLTAGLLLAWKIFRRWETRAAHIAFTAFCLFPLGIGAAALASVSPFDLRPAVRAPIFWPAALACSMPALWFALARPRQCSRWLRAFFFYLWPVLAVVVIQAARQMVVAAPFTDGAPATVLEGRPAVRVVWIIFDELSQNLAFARRPAGLELPNLDTLRHSGFYATAARSPEDMTERAIPALTLGERVLETQEHGPGELLVRTASHSALAPWSAAPNVFDRVRALGFNTALVGWFHPYGRELGRSLTYCYWTASRLLPGIEEPFEPEPLATRMAGRLRLQFSVLPLVGRIGWFSPLRSERVEKQRKFQSLVAHARQAAADPSFGLVFIHLPVPHPPGIYDRRAGRLSSADASSYIDNLALADRTLGELLRVIGGNTAVLVSADHGWRPAWREAPGWTAEEEAAAGSADNLGVPFLLRLPGETAAVEYSRPLNTVVTSALILEILSGHIGSSARVPEWLASH